VYYTSQGGRVYFASQGGRVYYVSLYASLPTMVGIHHPPVYTLPTHPGYTHHPTMPAGATSAAQQGVRVRRGEALGSTLRIV